MSNAPKATTILKNVFVELIRILRLLSFVLIPGTLCHLFRHLRLIYLQRSLSPAGLPLLQYLMVVLSVANNAAQFEKKIFDNRMPVEEEKLQSRQQ